MDSKSGLLLSLASMSSMLSGRFGDSQSELDSSASFNFSNVLVCSLISGFKTMLFESRVFAFSFTAESWTGFFDAFLLFESLASVLSFCISFTAHWNRKPIWLKIYKTKKQARDFFLHVYEIISYRSKNNNSIYQLIFSRYIGAIASKRHDHR